MMGNWNYSFEKYQQRINFVENIGLPPRHKKEQIYQDLTHMENEVIQDISFTTKGQT